MRNINRSLGESFESFPVQLVQHDRQQDRNRKTEEKTEEVQQESVRKHPSAVIAVEEFHELLQAYPLAAGNTESCFVIPEGNLDAVHREITEDNKERQAGQEQNPQLPVAAQGHTKPVPDSASACGSGYGNTHQESSFGVFGTI